MNEANLDNELVKQKDRILALVNDEKYEEALMLLNFASSLWTAAGYNYKEKEIRHRIENAIRAQIWNAEHWKTRQKWENMLATV